MTANPSILQPLSHPLFTEKQVKVWIKRDDLLHPHIMGNKWRKLKYNLKQALKENKHGLITFGGAYSNHIAATAACAAENGLKSIGIIRGDELDENSNHTLRFAKSQGMVFRFVDRSAYRALKDETESLQKEFPEYYVLPEGGTNELAIQGAAEVVGETVGEIGWPFDFLLTAYGTGGTMAGLLKGMDGKGKLIGISSLKGDFIHDSFRSLCLSNHIIQTNYELIDQYHFGGYGKVDQTLIDHINFVKENIGITLDPIYTGKMFYAFWDLLHLDFFQKESKIILLHTGGLQGITGYNEKQGKIVLH